MSSLTKSNSHRLSVAISSILLCWLAVISLGPSSATTYLNWPWNLGIQIPSILLLLQLLYFHFSNYRASQEILEVRHSAWVIMGLGLLLLVWIAGTFDSTFPWRSGYHLLVPVAAGASAMIVWVNLRSHSWQPAKLFRFIAVLGILVCVFSLLYWVLLDLLPAFALVQTTHEVENAPSFWSVLTRFRNIHPFGHSNYVSGFATLMIPMAGLLSVFRRSRDAWLWRTLLVLALVTGWSSGSRAVWLSLGGMTVLGAAYYVIFIRCNWKQLFLIGSGILIILLLLITLHARTRETVLTLAQGEGFSESDNARIALITSGIRIGIENPLWGAGSGTTPLIYPRFWNGRGTLTNAFQLHSTPVQVFASWGGVGLAAIILLYLAPFFSWHRSMKRSSFFHSLLQSDSCKDDNALLSLAAVSSLIAYGIFSFTDFQLDVPGIFGVVGLLWILTLFITLSSGREGGADEINLKGTRFRAPLHWVTGSAVLVFFLFFSYFQVQRSRADFFYENALQALQSGDFEKAEQRLNKAVRCQPDDPFYYTHFGWMVLNNRTLPGSLKVDDLAIQYWQKSLDIWQKQAFCHYNLGWLYLKHDADRSLQHFREAAKLEPSKRGIYFGTALALRKAGRDESKVTRALALECLVHPRFQFFTLWNTPRFAEVHPDVIHEWDTLCRSLDPDLMQISPVVYQQFRESVAIGRWWQGMDVDEEVLLRSSYGQTVNLGMLIAREKNNSKLIEKYGARELPPLPLIVRAYLSSASADSSRQRIEQAISAGSISGPRESSSLAADRDTIARFFEAQKRLGISSFTQVLRNSPKDTDLPMVIFQNTRSAFPFIYGHIGFQIPGDQFVYQESLLLHLSLDEVFPKRGYIPREIISELSEPLFE